MKYPEREMGELAKLNLQDVDRLAKVNAMGIAMQNLIDELNRAPDSDRHSLVLARVYLRTGFMWLRKVIVKPQEF